jgi:hypothetical protein
MTVTVTVQGIGTTQTETVADGSTVTIAFSTSGGPPPSGISFVGEGGYVNGTATSVTLNKPAGVVAGDMMIAFVSIVAAGVPTCSSPGWTLIGENARTVNGGFISSFYKIAGSSEPSTYVFTNGGSYVGTDGISRAFRGAVGINAYAGAQSETVPALSETFVSGEWYVACAVDYDHGPAPTSSPALSNTFYNVGSGFAYFSGSYIPTAAPGAEAFVWTTGTSNKVSAGFTIHP